METLESLRHQIETTQDLHGIVRTMKSLSAVSIRQYERAAEALEGYEQTVHLGLKAVLHLRHVEIEEAVTGGPARGVVLFGSDHGLCGRFNEELLSFAETQLPTSGAALSNSRILAVGNRMADRLTFDGHEPESMLEPPATAANIAEAAYRLVEEVERWRAADVGEILLLHNRRGKTSPALPTMETLLPLRRAWLRELRDRPWPARGLPTYRASTGTLFPGLVRQHLLVTIFRAIAESLASEHASRLASMEAAERNIEEHLEELQSEYRRSRQASITEELMDIVAGYVSVGEEADGERRD